jgi:hypothetical protein
MIQMDMTRHMGIIWLTILHPYFAVIANGEMVANPNPNVAENHNLKWLGTTMFGMKEYDDVIVSEAILRLPPTRRAWARLSHHS